MKNKLTNKSRLSRKGVIVVLFALLVPVLIVILGFTIDFANMQRVRNEARLIADLSAKAAADTLARTGGDQAAAITAAKAVAGENSIAGLPHDLQTSEIQFGRSQLNGQGSYNFDDGKTPFNAVRVNALRNDSVSGGRVNLFFGLFYGQPTFDLHARSTASFRDVEICLVLDRSGSMKWKTVGTTTSTERNNRRCIAPMSDSRWMSLDSAIDAFLTELDSTPVKEKVAMVTFASDGSTACGMTSTASKLDENLTTDLNKVRNEMSDYESDIWFGGTNITAGLATARAHMVSNGNANRDRFIIVFTDGQHNNGDPPFDEATACAAAGMVVHTITFSDDANTADMITTANNGGGDHYHANATSELETIFRNLAGSFTVLTD